jgi:hypothetical protein
MRVATSLLLYYCTLAVVTAYYSASSYSASSYQVYTHERTKDKYMMLTKLLMVCSRCQLQCCQQQQRVQSGSLLQRQQELRRVKCPTVLWRVTYLPVLPLIDGHTQLHAVGAKV